MRFLKLGSIQTNLSFLVGLAVLPALLILLYSGIEQRQASIENAKHNVTLLTHSMAHVQNDISRSARQILSTLALLPEIKATDITASSKLFMAVLNQNPDYKNITMTDLNGNVLASALPFTKTNLADRKHFTDALQRKDFSVGEYIITRVGSTEPALPFAYPVLDAMDKPIAVLTTVINLTLFANFYDVATLPDKSFIAITDNQGIRLFYYPPEEGSNPIGQPIRTSSWAAAAAQAQEAGMFIGPGSDGTTRVLAFEKVRLAPGLTPYMYLWAGIPETNLLHPANNSLVRNLLFMFLATAVALFISRVIGKKTLVAPIENLVRVTENFARGDLRARGKQTNRPGELGRLTRAFYEMADSLAAGQKTLLANETRFRTVMDSLDALVYVADMETYEILFINEYGKRRFGEIVGQTCWQHLQENQIGPCPFCTNNYLWDGENPQAAGYSWEFQNTLNGNWYQVHDRAIRWVDGRIVRLEIATDISARKLAEEQLRQKFKMEAIGTMAGGIAHNFNNSLAVVLGNIEVSKLKLPHDSPVVPFLNNAKRAINGATELVRQILTYSHKGTDERTAVRLAQVINDTLELLKPTIPSSVNLQVTLSDESQGLTINTDPTQIQDVLINLCNNAVFAMAEKGALTISLSAVTLQPQDIPAQYERPPGDYLKLSVTDTGSGMSSETIEKIFDPFFTTKQPHEGTGMGLSTVQGVVTLHGGLIKVKSALGQGSTFELYFPASDSQQEESLTKDQTPPGGTDRILFVDDDEMLATTWSQALAESGYQVTTETSSHKALQLFKSNPDHFDLVITDQTMPELTGKEFIKEVLEIRQDIPTILCSGYSHIIDEEEAQVLGIKAFCPKPIALDDLLNTIRRVLNRD